MTAPIRLYYWFSRLGRAEQIRLLLVELDLAWEEVDTEWGTDAWRALFPTPLAFGAQPAIVDGDLALTQSAVILSYLARKHGLVADDLRAQVLADAAVGSAEDLRMAVHRARRADKVAELVAGEWPSRWLRALDHHLAATGFVAGAFSHADLAWWDALDQLATLIPDVPFSPAVAAFRERIAARPRIAAYLASERRPPAEE